MAHEQQAIDVSNIPAMKELVDEVFRTRQARVLRDDETGAEVVVKPATPKRSRVPRGKPTSVDDPLWKIVGMAKGDQPTDVSENHDKYLADWELSKMR